MGMGLSRKTNTSGIPYWQRVDQLVQGGFAFDATGLATFDATGNRFVIPGGTPMIYDESTRLAKPVTVGKLATAATGNPTTYNETKGNRYKIGDNYSLTVGGVSSPITNIDRTANAGYDVITTTATVGNGAVGQLSFASPTAGSTAAAFTGVNGLLYDDQIIDSGESVSIVLRATAYARRVPYSAALDTALKNAGTFIIYSQSL